MPRISSRRAVFAIPGLASSTWRSVVLRGLGTASADCLKGHVHPAHLDQVHVAEGSLVREYANVDNGTGGHLPLLQQVGFGGAGGG
jgi:hypothetical protein